MNKLYLVDFIIGILLGGLIGSVILNKMEFSLEHVLSSHIDTFTNYQYDEDTINSMLSEIFFFLQTSPVNLPNFGEIDPSCFGIYVILSDYISENQLSYVVEYISNNARPISWLRDIIA